MGISVYLLLNEKNMANPHANVAGFKPVKAKKIGEHIRQDFPVYELQRQQIKSQTIYKFEAENKKDSYELDEEELDAFSRGLNGLRDVRDAGQIMIIDRPADMNENKEYYE